MKKFFIFALVSIIIAAAAIFIYRYQIIRYSAEKIIRKALPDYIKLDSINFDFKNGRIILGGFGMKNAPYFSDRYFLEIDEIVCRYSMKGKNLLEGIEISEPVFKKPVFNIERLEDGKLNTVGLSKVVEKPAVGTAESGGLSEDKKKAADGKRLSDFVKLPEDFKIEDGKIIFLDRFNLSKPHVITFENIESTISLKLDDSYSKVLSLGSIGKGCINGRQGEVVSWDISFNPSTPKLTMSNRFEVSGANIVTFGPYYDKYSPFVFKKGRFSGTLIFDFDNGVIGSTNEVHLSSLEFFVKPGYENAQFWETTVPDLVKYFTSPYGDIVFDFKIKGEMSDPKFYLGPISKQALVSMAVDKISQAIEKASQKNPGEPKSDIDKAKDYIDMFKGLINKK